jgi:hypothetical protein
MSNGNRPRCCNIEPGQEYFQTLAIAAPSPSPLPAGERDRVRGDGTQVSRVVLADGVAGKEDLTNEKMVD